MDQPSDERPFSDEEQDALRARARALIEGGGLKQKAAAAQAGIAYTTFAAWLKGAYAGNNDKVAARAAVWLDNMAERRRAAVGLARDPGFRETPSARDFLEALFFAQAMSDIAVIVGGAGVGKTTACRHYAENNPNVWLATMEPMGSGINMMLHRLCEAAGVAEKAPARLSRAIGRRVAETGGLIIVDEAQHLKPESLDQLRSINDLYGVGIALVGNEVVHARIEGEGRKAQFAQLFSRIGVRLTRRRPRAADIARVIEAWGIQDREEARFLTRIAEAQGALRNIAKTLRLASLLAAGRGETLSLEHMTRAWNLRAGNAQGSAQGSAQGNAQGSAQGSGAA